MTTPLLRTPFARPKLLSTSGIPIIKKKNIFGTVQKKDFDSPKDGLIIRI